MHGAKRLYDWQSRPVVQILPLKACCSKQAGLGNVQMLKAQWSVVLNSCTGIYTVSPSVCACHWPDTTWAVRCTAGHVVSKQPCTCMYICVQMLLFAATMFPLFRIDHRKCTWLHKHREPYRALLKSAVSGTDHRVDNTKKTPKAFGFCTALPVSDSFWSQDCCKICCTWYSILPFLPSCIVSNLYLFHLIIPRKVATTTDGWRYFIACDAEHSTVNLQWMYRRHSPLRPLQTSTITHVSSSQTPLVQHSYR